MLRLYDNRLSGNGYKPRLLLAHLGRSYERVELDILKGETRTPEFLALNPNGRIPVLALEEGACIAVSRSRATRKLCLQIPLLFLYGLALYLLPVRDGAR